jgi:hypothetical protein
MTVRIGSHLGLLKSVSEWGETCGMLAMVRRYGFDGGWIGTGD